MPTPEERFCKRPEIGQSMGDNVLPWELKPEEESGLSSLMQVT